MSCYWLVCKCFVSLEVKIHNKCIFVFWIWRASSCKNQWITRKFKCCEVDRALMSYLIFFQKWIGCKFPLKVKSLPHSVFCLSRSYGVHTLLIKWSFLLCLAFIKSIFSPPFFKIQGSILQFWQMAKNIYCDEDDLPRDEPQKKMIYLAMNEQKRLLIKQY